MERSATAIRAAWTLAAAAALFGAATATLYAPLRGEDWSRVVPALHASEFARQMDASDRRFAVWLVARNAAAWAEAPWRLFDPGTCHPAENALTLGHPALSLGLLGAPGWIASGDPIVTYTTAMILQTLLAAVAMTLLVADWTRSVGAGLVAGALYAYLPAKTGYALYPFHGDSAWFVLSLLFARRLVTGGGALAALGLVASAALQFAASFYPFLASVCLGLPLAVWLVRSRDSGALRPAWLAAGAVGVLLAALLVFTPFLGARGGAILPRDQPVFASLAQLWPPALTSWPASLLALTGLVLPIERAAPALRSHPRVALLAGMLLTALVATSAGGSYGWLARLIPGFDAVRVPGFALSGVHLALCILAGMGAAGLSRLLAPRAAMLLLAALAVGVAVDALRPAWLGLTPRVRYRTVELRPPETQVAFFRELAAQDDRGPLVEAPHPADDAAGLQTASQRILLQAYHGRRTSSCYNSFVPDAVHSLGGILARVPEPEALRALREMGFTTLVVHPSARADHVAWRRRLERVARPGGPLTPVLTSDGLRAYAIAPGDPGEEPEALAGPQAGSGAGSREQREQRRLHRSSRAVASEPLLVAQPIPRLE